MFSAVAGRQIFQIVRGGNALGFSGTKKVPCDWVRIIAKRDLDRTFKAMYVTIIAGTLVGFMLFHERDELLGLPSLGLEVIIVRGASSCVHHLGLH